MNGTTSVAVAAAGLAAGLLIAFWGAADRRRRLVALREEAERLRCERAEFERRCAEQQLQRHETLEQWRRQFEDETRERRGELAAAQQRLEAKEEALERRLGGLERREAELAERERTLAERDRTVAAQAERLGTELARIGGLTHAAAREEVLRRAEEQARADAVRLARRIEEEATLEAARRARRVVTIAVERCAVEHVTESCVSVVPLDSDEVKGRIIGREGRNIRCFEHLTGVDLVIDDTPDAVVISAFDPIRREVARRALEVLLADGRIHPGRIEEVIERCRADLDQDCLEAGEAAAAAADVAGLPSALIALLGKLKYRTSYGQNVLQHSIEVAHLTGMMAAELGASVRLATRAGLLHDIGKAVDSNTPGPHAVVGMDTARQHGESPEVCHAIGAHHRDIEPASDEAILVLTADAISAARPGARRDSLESYIQRLERLEELAGGFEGVERVYAIQAGREVRILVRPEAVSDEEAALLARAIAGKIESDLAYPGQIKVTVIREQRTVEYAN